MYLESYRESENVVQQQLLLQLINGVLGPSHGLTRHILSATNNLRPSLSRFIVPGVRSFSAENEQESECRGSELVGKRRGVEEGDEGREDFCEDGGVVKRHG